MVSLGDTRAVTGVGPFIGVVSSSKEPTPVDFYTGGWTPPSGSRKTRSREGRAVRQADDRRPTGRSVLKPLGARVQLVAPGNATGGVHAPAVCEELLSLPPLHMAATTPSVVMRYSGADTGVHSVPGTGTFWMAIMAMAPSFSGRLGGPSTTCCAAKTLTPLSNPSRPSSQAAGPSEGLRQTAPRN